MSTSKLHEAITLIKSGDRQKGQKLLTEVLRAEPQNETAWLWMSSLVTGDKRRFCLEKVLSINPNNAHALQQMAKLSSSQPDQTAREVPVKSSSPATATTATPVQATSLQSSPSTLAVSEVAGDQHWLTPGKHLATIVYFSRGILLAFDVLPDLASQVINEIRGGATPKQLHDDRRKYQMLSICYVPFSRIATVKLFSESITIVSVDGSGNEKKASITCNKENSEVILNAIQQRLDPAFRKFNKPISRAKVLTSGVIASTVILCGTGFFYWFVQGLAAEGGVSTGSLRARGISNILLLIGPNGALCIGGVLMVIILFGLVSSLAKPPEETVLTRN